MEKMSGEREAANEAAGQAQARIATALQTIKELEAQAAAAAERERRLVEDLGQRDKTVYDLEIKLSRCSPGRFPDRVNQQLRSDLRHHIDHVGTLEHSNRQLIEAMSRHRLATGAEEAEAGEPPARRVAGE